MAIETISQTVRTEISKKNEFYISKHRYLELRHFCLQYKDWKKLIDQSSDGEYRLHLLCRISMIERAAYETDPELYNYLLLAITEDRSFTYLSTYLRIPCCRDVYYRCYRKFFYNLSRMEMLNL